MFGSRGVCEQSWHHSLWVLVMLQSLWLPGPVRLGRVLGTEGRSRGRLCVGHSQYEVARDERPQVNLHAGRGSSPAFVLCVVPLRKALTRVKQFGRAQLASQKELLLKAARLQSRDVSSGRFHSSLRVRFGAAFSNSVSLVSEAMFNVMKVFYE